MILRGVKLVEELTVMSTKPRRGYQSKWILLLQEHGTSKYTDDINL